jgi:hypothetical protein
LLNLTKAAMSIQIARFSIPERSCVAVLLIVASAACILLFGARTRNLIPKGAEWKTTGKFVVQGVYPSTKLDAGVKVDALRNVVFWGSWAGDDRNTGELISPTFRAPSILEMFVAGYPTKSGNGIFLEREDTHARMPVRIPAYFEPREHWEELYWMLPSGWREKAVRLIAVDQETGSGGWLGISSPRALNLAELLRKQLPAASIILLYPLNVGFFLLPGVVIAITLAARREVCGIYVVILAIVASASLGYLAFWVYFESRLLGRVFSFAVIGVSALALVLMVARSWRLRSIGRQMAVPFLYVLVVGICYLCLFFVFGNPFPSGAELAKARFYSWIRPGDNVIPMIFADRIYNRQPIEPFCCGDWLSSDRPPLQAGIFLLQKPLKVFGDEGLNYQSLGTALQCLWLCAVWTLLKTLRAPVHRIRQVLGFLAFSGFLFQDSVYVWPKLLASTFILFGLSIFFNAFGNNRPITSFETALAAVSLSLAMMAHPGSVFSLPAFLLMLIPKRRLLSGRQFAWGAILIVVFVAPWLAYQKFYDPPGNRLLKMHLAGVHAIDSRSTWQAIKDSYTKLDVKTYFQFKRDNVSNLIGPEPIETFGLNAFHFADGLKMDRQISERSRLAQGQYIWNAVGVLNAGWLGVLVTFLKRRKKSALRYSGLIVIASFVNLIVWSLVMFGPRATFTATSSFADILLLSIGLCGFLLFFPPVVVFLLFALQILDFFVVWVFSPPDNLNLQTANGIGPTLQLPLLTIGLGCALGLAWHFGRSYFERDAVTTSMLP